MSILFQNESLYVKEILPEFAVAFFVTSNMNMEFQWCHGQRLLRTDQNLLLKNAWDEFSKREISLDDFFNASILIAQKEVNQDIYIIDRQTPIKINRKDNVLLKFLISRTCNIYKSFTNVDKLICVCVSPSRIHINVKFTNIRSKSLIKVEAIENLLGILWFGTMGWWDFYTMILLFVRNN